MVIGVKGDCSNGMDNHATEHANANEHTEEGRKKGKQTRQCEGLSKFEKRERMTEAPGPHGNERLAAGLGLSNHREGRGDSRKWRGRWRGDRGEGEQMVILLGCIPTTIGQ